MADNHTNQAKFGKMLGITRQAVHKAILAGQIVKHGTGHGAYIDLACPLTVAYMNSDSENRSRSKGITTKPASAAPRKPRSTPKPKPPSTDKKKPAPQSPENMAAVEGFIDNTQVKSLKIKEELEKLRLGNMTTRGELIKRTVVQEFIHAMYEIDNGQLKTLGLKIASSVGAELEIDDDETIRRVCDVIDREVLAVMRLIKRTQNKHLKKMGAEKLPAKPKPVAA